MANMFQLLESRRSRIGRWAGAAIVVCGLHVGGAAAIMYWQTPDEEDDPGGVLSMDLAPVAASTPVDSPSNVAVGPEQHVAKLTPEAAKEVVEKEQKDMPVVKPSPAREPEIVLPKRQPDEKEHPKEEAKEAVAEKEKPQQEEEHDITTAPLRVEAPPATTPASGQGMSASMA